MRGFYYDIFLMLLTYGILTFLTIHLMKRRKRRNSNGGNNGGLKKPVQPIIPDLPEGVIWPEKIKKETEVLV